MVYVAFKDANTGELYQLVRMEAFSDMGVLHLGAVPVGTHVKLSSVDESEWTTALAFELCPCYDLDGKNLIRVEP